MKKNALWTAVMILLFLSLLSFTGCGKKNEDLRIGVILPLTGDLENYGQSLKKGMELAAEEVNSRGGVQIKKPEGIKKVILDLKDSQGKEDVGVSIIKDFIFKEKIKVVIGAGASSVTLAIAPIAEENNTILLSPASSSPEITDAGTFIFRNYPSDLVEGEKMASIAVKNLDSKKIVVFSINNKYGQGIKGVFIKKFRSLGGETLRVFNFTRGTTDFKAMVEEAKSLEPDTVYLVGYELEVTQLLKEIKTQEFECVKLGTSAFNEAALKQSGDAAEMLIFPRYEIDLQSEREVVRNFIQKYKLKYSEEPGDYAAYGYDALMMLAKAMEHRGDDPDTMQVELLNLREFNGVTGIVDINRQGDVTIYPKIYVVEEGVLILAEEYFAKKEEEAQSKKGGRKR